jgi:Fe-S-cluster containining protein
VIRVLSIHADYACRNTGVCCSSGWDVPVEPAVEDRLRQALARGALRAPRSTATPFRAAAGLPHGARVVLGGDAGGCCVFLEAGPRPLCAVHRHLGLDSLPSACRDFPRIVTLSPLGVSITLSHYCPTAAGLLFRDDRPLAIETDPPAFPRSWPYEGLDARGSAPPLVRPGVLMGWAAHSRWETHAVATLGREDLSADEALALLATQAEAARRWRPEDGNFDAHLARCLETPRRADPARVPPEECARAWRTVAECVLPGHPLPPPVRVEAIDGGWGAREAPVRRWLAARAFASWLAVQGDGLRTTVLGLRLSLSVLRAEVSRGAGGTPGEDGLREAIRRADLLLVHLADPEALARRLSRVEGLSGDPAPTW